MINRLTEKNNTGYDFIGKYNDNAEEFKNNSKLRDAILDKLGRLEDIEEIIEKMHTQPIYQKCKIVMIDLDYTNKHILYNFKNNTIEIYEVIEVYDEYSFIGLLKVEDYGKTWAFTKEELKDD